jgi:hypothetical protein
MDPEVMRNLSDAEEFWGNWSSQSRLLSDDDGRLEMRISIPVASPTFTFVSESLAAIEARVRLSLIFTWLDADQIGGLHSFEEVLVTFSDVPIRVTALSLSSVKVTIEGDPKEISEFLGHKPPPSDWKRRLLKNLALFFGGALLVLSVSGLPRAVSVPSAQEIRGRIEEACGYVPDGTVVKIKAGAIEAEVHCEADSQRGEGGL